VKVAYVEDNAEGGDWLRRLMKKCSSPNRVPMAVQLEGRGNMAKAGHRGLDGRHRDKSGRIEKKHGNTEVGSLRKEHGKNFAKGRRSNLKLKTLLAETESASLHDYLRHHHKK
jgi:hypothetical protein